MRQVLPTVVNNFSKGLITETTEISNPQESCTETFDCVFDRTGFVARRKAFDFETDYVLTNTPTIEEGAVFTEFVWQAVAGDGTISFLVQQHGSTLFFYDLSTSISVSPNKKAFSIDLNDYLPDSSPRNPAESPCQYAAGRGILTVVNGVIDPIYIVYDPVGDTITVTSYEITTRDFTGLTDTLDLTERYTGDTAALKSAHPAHYYNLLNQGWTTAGGAALSAWDSARSDMPSNADYVALYRESPTSIFQNSRVTNQDPLNTPAAKGHFILTATNPDRSGAMADEGFILDLEFPPILIDRTAGSQISAGIVFGFYDTGAFDGTTNYAWASISFDGFGSFPFADADSYVGKNYSASPKRIAQAIVYGSNDQGFSPSGTPSMTFTLMASQTAPASYTDGTSLGTVTFTDTSNEAGGRTITSSDPDTFWKYVWVYQNQAYIGGGNPVAVAVEVQFYSPSDGASSGVVDNISTTERPKTICFYAGRLFYSGLDAFSLGNTLFFTQILQSERQYGQCYQLNDPTSEELFSLLPSDGGTITVPNMGTVQKLFTYQNALLVLASNGVWMVTGGSSGGFGGGFQANDYFVKKLSSIGTSSALSVIDRRGVPIWWAEDGIYTITYDPNYNSFSVTNMTFKSIRSFFLDIPHYNRKFAKGTYDPVLDISYWVYNAAESPSDDYAYDSVLVYSGVNQAFYPWTIGASDPQVRGVIAVQDAARNNITVIKYPTTYPDDGDNVLLFSEHLSTSYLDWSEYAVIADDVDKEIDYTSYFITAYKVDGRIQQFFQANYIWVFAEMQPDASCYVQGLFDFYTDPDSGKWSTPQQLCKTYNAMRSVNFKRLKIRGKGRAMQLRFYSETGKPFQVQGWAMYETVNEKP